MCIQLRNLMGAPTLLTPLMHIELVSLLLFPILLHPFISTSTMDFVPAS